MQQNIESILDAAEQQQASDVFLQEDEIPRLKINEQIIVLGNEPLSLAHITAFWQACGANAQGDGDMDRDTGFVSRTHTRYRVSLHRTMGRLAAIRDYETALTALQASETGHLVVSTLHSEKVADTMERYLNLFPAENEKHGVNLLANQLSGVLCQKLVQSADGGLHLLVEHVENAGAMRDWIARRELQNIDQYISRGSDPAAVSFLQSTLKALQAKVITEATAMASVSNESELRRAMRGIG